MRETVDQLGVKKMNKVLLVEDDKQMLDLLEQFLQQGNYFCEISRCAKEALSYIKKERFSIVLLDVRIPEIGGRPLCEEIRGFSDVPVLLVTECAAQDDIIKGLKSGADDYITKPFEQRELLARIEVLLRRTNAKNEIEINNLCWNENCFRLTYKEESIKLTPKEFTILGYLMKNPNQVFVREQLINLIWGYASVTDERTVDSHVQNIREKVRQSGFPIDDHFKTVWGVGYKWVNYPS